MDSRIVRTERRRRRQGTIRDVDREKERRRVAQANVFMREVFPRWDNELVDEDVSGTCEYSSK